MRRLARLTALTLLLLAGCAQLAQDYRITPRASRHYAPTTDLQVIRQEPAQPYEILADFIGHEPSACEREEPLCTLRRHGKALGAHAAWIQEHIKTEHPADWILLDNKLHKIQPYTTETWRGIFIRYARD